MRGQPCTKNITIKDRDSDCSDPWPSQILPPKWFLKYLPPGFEPLILLSTVSNLFLLVMLKIVLNALGHSIAFGPSLRFGLQNQIWSMLHVVLLCRREQKRSKNGKANTWKPTSPTQQTQPTQPNKPNKPKPNKSNKQQRLDWVSPRPPAFYSHSHNHFRSCVTSRNMPGTLAFLYAAKAFHIEFCVQYICMRLLPGISSQDILSSQISFDGRICIFSFIISSHHKSPLMLKFCSRPFGQGTLFQSFFLLCKTFFQNKSLCWGHFM